VQRLLQALLSLPEPTYLHHEIVVHEDGRRLAKRDKAPTLAVMREAGADGRDLVQALVHVRLPAGFRLSEV
jgi:glutamyl-Q tRNA(Asp) synthetase